jgi:anti-repressor protein
MKKSVASSVAVRSKQKYDDDLFVKPGLNNITSTEVEATLFNFRGNKIRLLVGDEPWFVAKDLAEALGYRDAHNLCRRIDDDDKDTRSVSTPGGPQNMAVVNESGMYAAVLCSSLPGAKDFKRWVTSEVLPSIRKHGAYLTESKIEEILTSPDMIIRLATDLKNEREQRRIAEEAHKHAVIQIGVLEPKAQLADSFLSSKGNILVRDYAKHVKQALNIDHCGEKIMFRWLKARGYMNENRYPSQYAVDKGLLHVSEGAHWNPVLEMYERHHVTRITPKGQEYFLKTIKSDIKDGEINCD